MKSYIIFIVYVEDTIISGPEKQDIEAKNKYFKLSMMNIDRNLG